MIRHLIITLSLIGMTSSTLAQTSTRPEILTEACEVSIALSAAPDYLRSEASVYAFTQEGYQRVRTGDNPFTCVVNRDDPRVLKPTCFDAEGAETIIPKIKYFGQRMLAGASVKTINEEIAEKFQSGDFIRVRRPGVAYMLSRYNRPVNRQTGKLGFFPPHVMFYAPDLTNIDIGHDMGQYDPQQPTPMIGYQGPHGYMIMISDNGVERSRRDLDASCPAWIWDE
ncbi:MAG: hypothetical protein AAFX52_03860 [Pseudomonadota bacterium]